AEPVLPDPEDVARTLHLLATHLGDVGGDVGTVHLGDEDRAALAGGVGDDLHVDPLGDVAGGRGGALARLVVRVGVHVHQPEAGTRARLVHRVVGHGAQTRWDHRPRGGGPDPDRSVRPTPGVAAAGHDRV